MKYIIYAQGTMSNDGRENALYQRRGGAPIYTTGAYADRFDEAEADRITKYKGKYVWIKKAVRDKAVVDYDAKTQEDKLTSYSLEFRKRMNVNPKKKAEILLEAKAAYDNVVEDTDISAKQDIKRSADKHWKDLQGFADKLNDCAIKDDIVFDYTQADLDRANKMLENAESGAERKLIETLIAKIKFELESNKVTSAQDKLIESSSEEALSKNIATEIKAGKDPKQAAAIAYSIQKENDSTMKDGLNVTVKLNGKTYKGAFNGISGADKRFGDVYIPELVSLHSGDKGVFNPDEGNYVSDGKFYFKMENLKKWNPFLNDYIKDSAIKDADMFNITFERNGVHQSNLVRASSEEEAKQKFMSYAEKHNLPDAKIISVGPNKEGYKPGKPVIDAQPVKVIAKKAMEMQDGCSRHYLEVEDCDGKRFYMVTDEYDGCSRQFAGGGSIIQDKATLSKKYKDDLASGLTGVVKSVASGVREVKSALPKLDENTVDPSIYKAPLDEMIKSGKVKDGVSASAVDAILGVNNVAATKQLLKDAGIKYSVITPVVSTYQIVDGKCVKIDN